MSFSVFDMASVFIRNIVFCLKTFMDCALFVSC